MRRYRTLILVVLLGIIPAAIALSVSMWLYFGPDEEEPVALEEPIVTPPPEPVIPPVEVLAAARNLSAGTLLTANDLTYVPLEAQNVLSSHMRKAPADAEQGPPSVIGAVTRVPFLVGMPLTDTGLIQPGQDGFLAAVLRPDRRAITITVNQETSHAGMIAPGDRVDVIFTMQVASDEPSQLNSFSRTVLEDLRVVAVGRRIQNVNYTTPEDDPPPQDGGTTVTLEVRPPEADQLVLASTRGSLALALRPLGQAEDTGWRTPVGLNRLLPPPATKAPTPDPVRVQVFRGENREEVLLPQ
ncbi:Flp pilus assembly protein CpaB [Candidatus Poriferisocius sp.]|uniref:Flp pilus assembly protein CpaB n=1 Tax=Candidatus Poriferisocius sp. TaxID=3101276 RepID=UPI003B51D9EB